MASTIDFSTFDDQDLLYSYQRVNRSRFPDNFDAYSTWQKNKRWPFDHRFCIQQKVCGLSYYSREFDSLTWKIKSIARRKVAS